MVAAMSETVLYHVLDWHRRFYRYREDQAKVRWHRYRQYMASDHTVGFLGFGELGTDAAKKLQALGFNIAAWSRRPKTMEGVFCSTSIDEVLGSETIWRAVDAEKALRAYSRGQHDIVPKVKAVANKDDRQFGPVVIPLKLRKP